MKQKQERLHNLDVYKGICILFIILTHFNWIESQRLRMGFPFWVDMAVPVFMVISGYVYALLDSGLALKDQYAIRRIFSKWLRFIVPFFVVYILEIVVHIVLRDKITVSSLIYGFISGGEGPGSYYTPVMVQFILIIPVIMKVIEKWGRVGLAACFITNLSWELVKNIANLSVDIYRLLIFRYIFVIAYGVYLYSARERKTTWFSIICSCIGLGYIVAFCYCGRTPIITNVWAGTSMFASMFIFGVMKVLIPLERVRQPILELLGKASFNIFLVQMFYYWPVDNVVNGIVSNRVLQLMIGFVFSIVMGIIFYQIENPVTTRLIRKFRH